MCMSHLHTRCYPHCAIDRVNSCELFVLEVPFMAVTCIAYTTFYHAKCSCFLTGSYDIFQVVFHDVKEKGNLLFEQFFLGVPFKTVTGITCINSFYDTKMLMLSDWLF